MTWLSGRKFSVVGLSGPETSASVPVSAIPAKATLAALRSCPSEGPRLSSSAVSAQGRPSSLASAPIFSVADRLCSRRKRAISAGISAAEAISLSVAAERRASALKVASPPRPRSGTTPAGARTRRSATAARRGASAPVTCSERRILASISSRALIAPRQTSPASAPGMSSPAAPPTHARRSSRRRRGARRSGRACARPGPARAWRGRWRSGRARGAWRRTPRRRGHSVAPPVADGARTRARASGASA